LLGVFLRPDDEGSSSSETSVNFERIKWRYIPGDTTLNTDLSLRRARKVVFTSFVSKIIFIMLCDIYGIINSFAKTEGRKEERKEGRTEGRKEGRTDGRKKGRKETV
jgi:hypothetical protein